MATTLADMTHPSTDDYRMGPTAEGTALGDGAAPSSASYEVSQAMCRIPASAVPALRDEKVVSTSSGITVSLALTEPVVYLPHFDPIYPAARRSRLLSGHLRLRLTRIMKIKKVELAFKGVILFKLSGGNSQKFHTKDVKEFKKHVWPLFLAREIDLPLRSNNEYNLDHWNIAKPLLKPAREICGVKRASTNTYTGNSEVTGLTPHAGQGYALSFDNDQSSARGLSSLHRDYKLFLPGDYTYNFEHLVDSLDPETIENDYLSVKWLLEAIVERPGAFKSTLSGIRSIPFIRTPTEESLERVEPIAISRTWGNLLHCDMAICGKSFALGSCVPITLDLALFPKVSCHEIQVWVIENTHFHSKGIRHVRRESLLLFDRRAHLATYSKYPGSSVRLSTGSEVRLDNGIATATGEETIDKNQNNLLSDIVDVLHAGPNQIDLNVQLPSCQSTKGKHRGQKLHSDTAYQTVEITHRIKITLCISAVGKIEPTHRPQFQISMDSPLRILSCLASQCRIDLPAYSSYAKVPTALHACECACADVVTVGKNPRVSEVVTANFQRLPIPIR